jgi:hypothetical protein
MEAVDKQAGPGFALSVALMEALLADDTLFIQKERPGVGRAPVSVLGIHAIGRVLFVDAFVEQSERTDDAAALIREQRVGNAVPRGKGRQNSDRVIADREDGDALSFEVGLAPLQLDELRAAERSPVGAAIEHDQRAASGAGGV